MENTAGQLGDFMLNAYLGKNWVEVDFKKVLADITLAEANAKIEPLNTIVGIVYHLDYYVDIVLKRLRGDMLPSNANNGFDLASLSSEKAWQTLKERFYTNAEIFAEFVRQMDELSLERDFMDKAYGNNLYNIQGIIEHAYYHLGQIVLIKKMIRSGRFKHMSVS